MILTSIYEGMDTYMVELLKLHMTTPKSVATHHTKTIALHRTILKYFRKLVLFPVNWMRKK